VVVLMETVVASVVVAVMVFARAGAGARF